MMVCRGLSVILKREASKLPFIASTLLYLIITEQDPRGVWDLIEHGVSL